VTTRALSLELLYPLLLFSAAVFPAAAQDTTVARTDTAAVGQDTTRADSISLPPAVTLPTAAPAVPSGPLPQGTRYTFTQDSILWANSITLADLLKAIPGVYVVRAGYIGQPEFVSYAGRAGAAIELFWDGMPMPSVGPDSLFHDLARINLTYLQQVDVQVLPSTLRIYLVSRSYDRLAPFTYLRVMRGDYNAAAYAGVFQKRWPSGIGLNLAGDVVSSDGASGPGRSDQTFDLWGRLEWFPTSRSGASYQIRRQQHDRDPVGEGPTVARRFGARTDFMFTFFAGTRADGLGFRAEGMIGSSSWASDSITPEVPDQTVRQARLKFRYQRPSWTAEMTGRIGDARVTSELVGRFGWTPLRGVVLSADGRWQNHPGDRTSISGYGTLGLFSGPFSLMGAVEFADAVHTPALIADSAQRTLDPMVRASFSTFPITANVALVKREAFLPRPYNDLPVIPSFDSSAEATYVVADLKFRTSRALAFQAWYSTPVRDGRPETVPGAPRQAADLQPPNHARVQVTFRSKFWRTFRSGTFDFKVQVAMESWSGGTAGLDESGVPIVLKGATFYEAFLQLQLGGFRIFWDFRNAYNSPDPYVPGLTYPTSVQSFGIKWQFLN
jgi:hypothetical protein